MNSMSSRPSSRLGRLKMTLCAMRRLRLRPGATVAPGCESGVIAGMMPLAQQGFRPLRGRVTFFAAAKKVTKESWSFEIPSALRRVSNALHRRWRRGAPRRKTAHIHVRRPMGLEEGGSSKLFHHAYRRDNLRRPGGRRTGCASFFDRAMDGESKNPDATRSAT